MITGADQLTAAERVGATDCLVDWLFEWLRLPFGGMRDEVRGRHVLDFCLIVSQLRHRDPKLMDVERRRWIERAVLRLATQVPDMKGYEGAMQAEFERRVTVAMLDYHDWREKVAPVFSERGTS